MICNTMKNGVQIEGLSIIMRSHGDEEEVKERNIKGKITSFVYPN